MFASFQKVFVDSDMEFTGDMFHHDTIFFVSRKSRFYDKLQAFCFRTGFPVVSCFSRSIMKHIDLIITENEIEHNPSNAICYSSNKFSACGVCGKKGSACDCKRIKAKLPYTYIEFPNEITAKDKKLTKFQKAMNIKAQRHDFLTKKEEFKKSLRSHSSSTAGYDTVPEQKVEVCAATTTKNKKCMNKVVSGTRYCGIPSHRKLGKNYVKVKKLSKLKKKVSRK